jgi:beta-lactamase class A
MSVTGLGTNKRRFRLPVLPLISGGLLLVALAMLALELTRFAQTRDRLQTDISVAGVTVTGLTESEAAAAWESVYQQPIELQYQGYPIQLLPSAIGFRVNSTQMLEEIRAQVGTNTSYWADFWNYLWQKPSSPIRIDLLADFSEAKLRTFLEDLAARYDRGASTALFDSNTLTFSSGAAGARLDIRKSIEAIQAVLFKPRDRQATLVMENEGARAADMKTLKDAIKTYFDQVGFASDGPSTLASVGVIDLQNGQELWINPDIAYSAMSTIKIPILINIFSKLAFAPDDDVKWLMGASILCSNNSASNFLMQITGTGANEQAKLADGLRQVSKTVEGLGDKYTFINAPLYVGQAGWSINDNPPPVPNPNFDAKPDRWSRTTAEDMAVLLQEIYDCAEYGSGLAAAMPGSFTQTECKQMIELLSGNIINRLIELGAPAGTRVAHKNGWGGTPTGGANVSDAAIVFTPGGNYILSAYMWEAQANQDGIGSLKPWETIEGVSRIVYNYFNPNSPLMVSRVPENALGAIDCVMPNPEHKERLSLDNINSGRFDAQGHLEPDACYGYPACGKDTPPPMFQSGAQ